jgi:hypothetical protein
MRRALDYKLGRSGIGIDPLGRTLRLEPFIGKLPDIYPVDNFPKGLPLSDYGNKDAGCCAVAAPAGQVWLWTNAANPPAVVIPTEMVLDAYCDVTASEGAEYNPMTGENDNGCVMLDVMKHWRKVGIGGHKIDAFGTVGASSLRAAIWIWGGALLGLSLPDDWREQMDKGDVWDILKYPPNPDNGH